MSYGDRVHAQRLVIQPPATDFTPGGEQQSKIWPLPRQLGGSVHAVSESTPPREPDVSNGVCMRGDGLCGMGIGSICFAATLNQ